MTSECTGYIRLGTVDDAGVWTPRSGPIHNQRMATAGYIQARCVGLGDVTYRVAAAYLEFRNVASPSTTVSPPTAAYGDTLAYYLGLAGSADSDYLRVPLRTAPAILPVAGDEAFFAAGQGNSLEYLIQSSGTAGVYGKPFGPSHNSLVYGVALVATPAPGDPTRDVLFARAYIQPSDQLIVPANGQVAIPYYVPFKPAP
jgi:hypothetical protein